LASGAGSAFASREALFVVRLDPARRQVIVGPRRGHS